jgi:hypothetical protein
MAFVECKKDIIGILLILRSVCAQNKGSVKVDEEYQNLITLHSALGYKQKKSVNNTTFGKEVLNRYEAGSRSNLFFQNMPRRCTIPHDSPKFFKKFLRIEWKIIPSS